MRPTLFIALWCIALAPSLTAIADENDDLESSQVITAPLPSLGWDWRNFFQSIEVRSWLSTGTASESIAGNIGPPHCDTSHFVDVLSDLNWRSTQSIVTEISAELMLNERVMFHADVGFGGIDDGSFRDEDFCLSGRRDPFSDTLHPASDGSVFYLNLDFLYQVYSSSGCTFEVFIGQQTWQEEFVASDGMDLLPGTRTADFQGHDVITQEYLWRSVRIGGRVTAEINSRLKLQGRLALIPLGSFRLEDIHHLRADLRKDPSFIDTASIKFGLAADTVLSCRIWRGLYAEVGYQFFYNKSQSGDGLTRTKFGEIPVIFNGATMTRHGLLVGLKWEF